MGKENSDELPVRWKKIQVITGLIGTILVPFVAAYIGNSINQSIKNNELGLSYVQLAVGILREQPKPETENLRKWAIEVVNNYSAVDLPEEARLELKQEKLSVSAIDIAASFEPFASSPTPDSVGVQFIGYGHSLTSEELKTGKILIDGEPVDYRRGITEQQARKLLEQEMKPFRQSVDDLVTVKLTKNQLDALSSFVYNVGVDTLKESTLLKVLNQGKYDQVPAELSRWTKAGGQEFPELRKRREKEIELWNQKD